MLRTARLAVCASVLGLVPAAAGQVPGDEELVATIDSLAAAALCGPGAAGLSVTVARGDGLVLAKGYGYADLEHRVPAGEATLFRIASVTKQYTAAAIVRLAEQGRLGLDDELTQHVDFPVQGRAITLRHLLQHTSGLKNYTDLTAHQRPTAGDVSPEEVLADVRGLPLEFEPGTAWAYSNTGYHLLGMVIEKVSGVPYATCLQREFFGPLGLARTRYDDESELIPGRARGYRLLDGRTANAGYINMDVPYASGGLLASAGDLVAWQLALAGGRVVSPGSYREMTTPATLADGTPTDYGFGLRVRDLDGHRCVTHSGGVNGFNSVLSHYPDDGLSVAVISNSDSIPAGPLAVQIAREALGIAPGWKDLVLDAAELEPLTGRYRIEALELDFVVLAGGGRLFVQGTGEPPVPVQAQGGGEFRATWDPSLRIVFDPPAAPGGRSPAFGFEQDGGSFRALRVD